MTTDYDIPFNRSTTLGKELRRRGGEFGMLSVCAAGGMGHVMVVERA